MTIEIESSILRRPGEWRNGGADFSVFGFQFSEMSWPIGRMRQQHPNPPRQQGTAPRDIELPGEMDKLDGPPVRPARHRHAARSVPC